MSSKNISRDFFLSLFFSGKSKRAPGTIGSLVALILGIPLWYFSQNTIFLVSMLIGAIAIKEIDKFEKNGGKHDDKSIVIDELVGMWIAMSFTTFSVIGAMLAFVFFRIFDISKPSLIGKIDKNTKGGLGVVGDDVLAGVVAGIISGGITALLEKANVLI